MCRHCERIVEDVQHVATVHAFMAAAADGINRSLGERGVALMSPVVADDLDVVFNFSAETWHRNHFADNLDVVRLLYYDMIKATE